MGMNKNDKATTTAAFVTGVATAIPAFVIKYVGGVNYLLSAIAVLVWLVYIFAIFKFVLGPFQWRKYRWVPIDNTEMVLLRGSVWVLGGGLSIGILEAANAI